MKNTVKGLFGVYLVILAYLLFFLPNRHEVTGGNLVPFHTIKRYKQQYELLKLHFPTSYGIEAQIYGNILIFIPLGMLLPILFKRFRNPLLATGFMFCLSLVIELTQRIFRVGQFDVDDIILNGIGGIVGVVAFIVADWSLWEFKRKKLTLE